MNPEPNIQTRHFNRYESIQFDRAQIERLSKQDPLEFQTHVWGALNHWRIIGEYKFSQELSGFATVAPLDLDRSIYVLQNLLSGLILPELIVRTATECRCKANHLGVHDEMHKASIDIALEVGNYHLRFIDDKEFHSRLSKIPILHNRTACVLYDIATEQDYVDDGELKPQTYLRLDEYFQANPDAAERLTFSKEIAGFLYELEE